MALCGAFAVPTLARANFEVTYLFTDSEGNALTGARLTANEMNSYVNLASCQCGETFGVRVFLNSQTSTINASTRVRTYVGTSCPDAQIQNNVGGFNPCVLLYDGLANEYDDIGLVLEFDQVWLASGTSGINQSVTTAAPIGPCEEGRTGTGQIWICVDNNGDSTCTPDEFISPTIINSTGDSATPTDPMNPGQAMASGIAYDYLEPQNALTGFATNAGDGKVVITWDQAEVNDLAGFRVLCVDQNGEPPVEGQYVSGLPTGQARTNGTLYYTPTNVCEDPVYGSTPNTGNTDAGGETGGSDSGDGGSTSGRGGASGGSDSGTTGGSTGLATDGGSTSSGGSASDGRDTDTTGGDSTGQGVACDEASSVLCTLDWAYVCSEHVPSNSTRATVTGLRNDEPYEFLVVAYDRAGNPRVVSDVFTATPIETLGLWEQCEQQGDICGNGGFCHCTTDPSGEGWLGLGLLLLGLARRRARR